MFENLPCKPLHLENIQLMSESVKKCLDEWIGKTFQSDETVLDIADAMQLLTVAIIGKVGFNYDISLDEVELGVTSLKYCYLEFARETRKYPQRKFFPWFYAGVRNAKKASKDLRALASSILTQYRNILLKEGEAEAYFALHPPRRSIPE
jgi:cytochrome P450